METEYTSRIDYRLRLLERDLKRARAFVVLLGLTLFFLLATGQRKPARVIEAERFVLTKDGTYYGEMGFSSSGIPVVVISPGNPHAKDELPESSGGFYLVAQTGRAHIQLGHDGGATLQVGSPELMSVVSEGRFMVYEKNRWKWGAP